MLFVRSYAVAVFVVDRGIEPIAIDVNGPTVMFTFPDSARPALDEYRVAKRKLDNLVEAQSEGGGRGATSIIALR